MLPFTNAGASVDTVAHVIQVALTPVFLLSAIGTLLNVFNARLARVADHTEHTADLLRSNPHAEGAALLRMHLWRLSRRRLSLDISIVLAALGAAFTCLAALALFVGVVRNTNGGYVLLGFFGGALACAVGALAAFISDSVLAWHGLQREGALPHIRQAHRT